MKLIKKILTFIILIISIMALAVVSYFYRVDIQSTPPKEIREQCNIKDITYMNRKVFYLTAKGGPTNNLYIIYLHGGAYVAEATYAHWQFIVDLAEDTGATILLPDYPLTPKYQYKNVFEMLEPLYEDCIKRIGADNLILMGDSAGGGLSLALAEKMGENQVEQPKRIILLSPWLDVTLNNPQIDEVQKNDPILIRETLRLAGIAYAGIENLTSYLVSPVYGPLDKLKQLTIYTGTYDILNPDVHLLNKRAEEVGLKLDIKEKEKGTHIWMLDRKSEDSKSTYDDIVSIVKSDIE